MSEKKTHCVIVKIKKIWQAQIIFNPSVTKYTQNHYATELLNQLSSSICFKICSLYYYQYSWLIPYIFIFRNYLDKSTCMCVCVCVCVRGVGAYSLQIYQTKSHRLHGSSHNSIKNVAFQNGSNKLFNLQVLHWPG